MQDYATGWFDTLQTNLQANCKVRVTRNFQTVRIDWTGLMSLKNSSNNIAQNIYIDIMVKSSNTKIEDGQARIKTTSEAWNGTPEHSINGYMEFEDTAAGTATLTFTSTGNFASPQVFNAKTVSISWEKYDPDAVQETPMPFHSVFTTEEYLETHKGLVPRNNICYYKSKYVS